MDSYKKINSMQESIEWGKKFFGDWFKEFQDGNFRHTPSYMKDMYEGSDKRWKTAEAFDYYCGFWAQKVNDYLRGKPIRTFELSKIQEMIPLLFDEIQNNIIPEDIEVVRYFDLNEAFGNKKLKVGDTFNDEAFISTCLCDEDFKEERDFQFKMVIQVPAGTHGIYLDFISKRMSEQEILLNPSTFKIIFVKRKLKLFGPITELIVKVVDQPNTINY